jgi:hypothetical protein
MFRHSVRRFCDAIGNRLTGSSETFEIGRVEAKKSGALVGSIISEYLRCDIFYLSLIPRDLNSFQVSRGDFADMIVDSNELVMIRFTRA